MKTYIIFAALISLGLILLLFYRKRRKLRKKQLKEFETKRQFAIESFYSFIFQNRHIFYEPEKNEVLEKASISLSKTLKEIESIKNESVSSINDDSSQPFFDLLGIHELRQKTASLELQLLSSIATAQAMISLYALTFSLLNLEAIQCDSFVEKFREFVDAQMTFFEQKRKGGIRLLNFDDASVADLKTLIFKIKMENSCKDIVSRIDIFLGVKPSL